MARTLLGVLLTGVVGEATWMAGEVNAADAPVLSATVIRGARVYSPLQLLPAYQHALGQPINQVTAQSIITAIEALYVRDGFARPEFQFDTAQIQDGILGIEVFEGRFTAVVFSGDAGPYRDKLAVLAAELTAQQPLRPKLAQDVIRRMSALPGLTVTVTTKPDASARNGFIAAIHTQFDFLQAKLRFTNRGTRDVGPAFVIGELTANGVLGRALKAGLLFGLAADTREFRGAGIFIDAPLVGDDTRWNSLGFRSDSNPTEHPQDFNVDYLHDRATLGVAHHWQGGLPIDLISSATFELDDLLIGIDGSQVQTDRLRVIDFTTQGFWRHNDAVQYITVLSVRHGLDGLGSGLRTAGVADQQRRNDFTSLRLQTIRLGRLNSLWQWRIDALGQYSSEVLADRERFKIGGDRLGRGFEVPALAGDQGIGAKLELRRDWPRLSSRFGELSVYGSYDIGVTRTNDLRISQSAATAAIGTNLQGRHLSGYLELARPLTHPDVDGRRTMVVFADLSLSF